MLSIGGLTLSFICKTLLLTGLLLALSWLSGCSAERLFRLTLAPAERPAVGFVLLMACGEIVGWPVVAFRLSSALFMALVGAAAAALASGARFHRPAAVVPRAYRRGSRIGTGSRFPAPSGEHSLRGASA